MGSYSDGIRLSFHPREEQFIWVVLEHRDYRSVLRERVSPVALPSPLRPADLHVPTAQSTALRTS